jgi:hypothetical protein
MRIIKPFQNVSENDSAMHSGWLDEWKKNQGKWVQLSCGCIEDIHLPKCTELLTGKKIYILCPHGHGFGQIVKSLSFKEVLISRGIDIPDDNNNQLPPF